MYYLGGVRTDKQSGMVYAFGGNKYEYLHVFDGNLIWLRTYLFKNGSLFNPQGLHIHYTKPGDQNKLYILGEGYSAKLWKFDIDEFGNVSVGDHMCDDWETFTPSIDNSIYNIIDRFIPSDGSVTAYKTDLYSMEIDMRDYTTIAPTQYPTSVCNSVPPVLVKSIDDITLKVGAKVEFELDEIFDHCQGVEIVYEAYLDEIDPLPAFIDFNPDRRQFSIQATQQQLVKQSPFTINIMARAQGGFTKTSTKFKVNLQLNERPTFIVNV